MNFFFFFWIYWTFRYVLCAIQLQTHRSIRLKLIQLLSYTQRDKPHQRAVVVVPHTQCETEAIHSTSKSEERKKKKSGQSCLHRVPITEWIFVFTAIFPNPFSCGKTFWAKCEREQFCGIVDWALRRTVNNCLSIEIMKGDIEVVSEQEKKKTNLSMR